MLAATRSAVEGGVAEDLLAPETRFRVPDDVLFRDLGGESVLLHLGSGQYFGLDEVGTFLWNALADGQPVGEVERSAMAEYDVTAERLRRDVVALVTELADQGLLEVKPL